MVSKTCNVESVMGPQSGKFERNKVGFSVDTSCKSVEVGRFVKMIELTVGLIFLFCLAFFATDITRAVNSSLYLLSSCLGQSKPVKNGLISFYALTKCIF